jgi:lipooligosaccharide transport system permease protein
MGYIKWNQMYAAMLATPLRVVEVLGGHLAVVAFHLFTGSLIFVLVAAPFGAFASWWVVLAVPVALLIALGFGAVGMAITSFLRNIQQLDWITTAILPMFLFSTTFYPLRVYPPAIQAVVRCLPLYQGIELMRGLCLGIVSWGLLLHVLYFLVMAAIGIALTARRLDRLLLR